MSDTLTCEVYPRLDAISAEEWAFLFPDSLDSVEMFQLLQRSRPDGFAFHSIVVRQAGKPILVVPLFETRYRLSIFLDVNLRGLVNAAAKLFPGLLFPRMLGVGFLESEWSQVGIEPSLEPDVLDAAWNLALEALRTLAARLRVDMTVLLHFTTSSGRMLPMHKLNGFSEMAGLPYAQVPINFRNLEGYIETLSAKMRADLRRKLRKTPEVEVRRTRDAGPWIDTIYRLYLETVAQSEVVFLVHPRTYFEQVCGCVPGAEYWLYFVKGRLLAFKLLVVRPDCVVDKYFGMDHVPGRAHNLYFIAWVDIVRYCMDHGIPLYHAGQANEDTKRRLGAQFVPSLILFRHRYPLFHRLLTLLSRHLTYESKVDLPSAQLGTGWVQPMNKGKEILK